MADMPSRPIENPQADDASRSTHISGGQIGAGNNYGTQTNNFGQISVATCPPPPEEVVCLGRDDKIAEVIGALQGDHPVTITAAIHGVGGLGKTTLAKYLAHHLRAEGRFEVVIWVNVGRNPSLPQILQSLAFYGDSLYQPNPTDSPDNQALIAKAKLQYALEAACGCAPNRALFILDDVWDEEAASLLYKAIPTQAALLITTRFTEIDQWLDKALPTNIKLGYMTPAQAAEMLRAYLPGADEDLLLRLGKALGGHALSLTLARSLIQTLKKRPGAVLNTILKQQVEKYEEGLPRHTSFADLKLEQGVSKEKNLTQSLYYSYEALPSDDDRRRFRALGILADAPLTVELLAALWDLPLEAVEEQGCDILRQSSLLEVTEDGSLYQVHPLLHSYARALLDKAGETEAVFGRYADFIIEVAEQFNTLQPEDWNSTLAPYYPHILYMGDEVVMQTETGKTGDLQRAMIFANNITRYLALRREVQRLSWLEMGLQAARRLQTDADAERVKTYQEFQTLFLNEIGVLWDALGEKRKALEYYEQKRPINRALDDQHSEATTLNNMGRVWDDLGEKRKALDYYEQALPLYQVVEDRGGEATTLNNIGSAWNALGETHKALNYYEQALPLRRVVGDRGGEANTLNNIGAAWDALGETRKALEYYEQALPLYQAVGDRGGEGKTLNNIGMAWKALGETHKALAFYEQALPLYQAVGDRSGEAVTCFNIGMIYRHLGDLDQAITYVERCVQLDIEVEHPDLESDRRALEQLKRERDGGQSQEEQAAQVMRQLAQVYQQQGADAVRQFLVGKVPDDVIEAILTQLAARPPQSPTQNILPQEEIQTLVGNTVAVKTVAAEQLSQWHETLTNARADWQGRGEDYAIEVAFANALLAILDDQPPSLPADNPYASVVQQVIDAIQEYREKGEG